MGIDSYESPAEIAEAEAAGLPAFGVGDDCYIDTAIIDKNARIGRGARVANRGRLLGQRHFRYRFA